MANRESEDLKPGKLGINHIPDWSDIPQVMENKPEFGHLFLGGHLRQEVIEKCTPPQEPKPSYTRGSQPVFVPDLPSSDRIVVGMHFVKCEQCRNARDGKSLF